MKPAALRDLLLIIISSPSGAGKTTLTHRLLEEFPDLVFSVSHTTRRPRANETDGQDYHFTDEAGFRAMASAGEFAEWASVHGNLYGTSMSELDRARENKRLGIVFDVDYQGARQIKARLPQAIGIFILPPSLPELRRRLEQRGTDSPETISKRFNAAQAEIAHYLFFDYLVINDELDRAAESLRGIVRAERCRRARLADKAEALLRSPD